ncbi:UBA-like_superfamily [Hexamita inflata]|uniref:UBA-like superfamily n=1 Tax=Hexamita inflata TaxID=28002 RepID=A0AA86UYF5_9EUKA|nr:UBA-like superfamily [Hexamita inflata]
MGYKQQQQKRIKQQQANKNKSGKNNENIQNIQVYANNYAKQQVNKKQHMDQQQILTQFIELTKLSIEQAKAQLNFYNYNLDVAFDNFFESQSQNDSSLHNNQANDQKIINITMENQSDTKPENQKVQEQQKQKQNYQQIIKELIDITKLPHDKATKLLNQSKNNVEKACDEFFERESKKDQKHENKVTDINITVANSSNTKQQINIEVINTETRELTQVKGFFGIKKEFVHEKFQKQYLCEPEIPKTDEKPKQTEQNNEENTVNEPQKIENIIESQNPEIQQQSPKRNQNSNNNYQNNNLNRSSNQNNQSNKPLQVNNRPSQDIMEQLLPQGPEFEHLFEQNNQQPQHQEQQPQYTNQYANHSVAQNQFSPQVPFVNSRPMSQVPYPQNTQQNNFNNYQYNQAQFAPVNQQNQQVQNYNRFVQPAFQPNQQVNQRFQQNQVVNYSQQLNSQFNPQNQQSSIPQYQFTPQQPSNQHFIPQQSFNPAIQSPNVQQRQFNPQNQQIQQSSIPYQFGPQLSQPFNSPLQNQNQMFQQQFQNNQFNYNQFQTNSINQNVQIPFQQSAQQVQSAQYFNLPGNEIPTLNLSQKQE